MNKWIGIWIFLIAPVVYLTACQTTKKPTRRNVTIIAKQNGVATVDTFGSVPQKVAVTKPEPVKPTKPVTDNKQKVIDAITPLWQRQVDFNTFSAKAKMNFKGMGQSHDIVANIRIKKDQVIWVSVNGLGGLLPVARIYITRDSFLMINHLQKEVRRMHISEANKLLPAKVDFSILQNLLIGNALITKGKPVEANDQGGSLSLQVENDNLLQQTIYNKTDNNMRSLQMRTKDNRTEGMIQYGNYETIDGRNFAIARAVNLSNAGEPYYLSMNFSDVEFNKEVQLSISIPKNYKQK